MTLFLAFPLTSQFCNQLSTVPKERQEELVGSNLYLQPIENNDKHYLGKRLGSITDLETLELATSHIYSLLSILVPDYACRQHPLLLIAKIDHHELS